MAMILFFCYILLHYSHKKYLYVLQSGKNINVLQSSCSTDVVWHPLNLFKVFVNAIVWYLWKQIYSFFIFTNYDFFFAFEKSNEKKKKTLRSALTWWSYWHCYIVPDMCMFLWWAITSPFTLGKKRKNANVKKYM